MTNTFIGRLKRYSPDWRILVSSLFLVLAFPPWNLSFLIWIALIPWFATLHRLNTVKDAVVQGLWLSFFMTLGGFYWVAYVLHEFAILPWGLAILGLLLFGIICQPQFWLFGPILVRIQRSQGYARLAPDVRILVLPLIFSLAYAGLDWVLPKLFVDTLGHSLYASPNMRQIADIGGAPLLTVLVYLTNYVIWNGYQKFRTGRRLRGAVSFMAPQIALMLSLLIASHAYGTFRNHQLRENAAQTRDSIQLALIQANIGDFDKVAAESGVHNAAEKIMKTFFSLSEQALAMSPKPEALVWPETSYPSTFRTPQSTSELARDSMIERFVYDHRVPLLFGGYDRDKNKDFNTFFYLSPRQPNSSGPLTLISDLKIPQGDLEIYHKNILLLFGEYIPGAETFSFIKSTFPQVGNFGRGQGPSVVPIRRTPPKPPVLSGPIICYEALFPNYVIEAARKGSQMILNITNDSWFGPYGEPDLHLALTTFRSIETRLPQFRATNTGISALILPNGEITKKTAVYRPEIMNVTVPLTPPLPTLMMKWGDWFGTTAFIAGVFLILFFFVPGSYLTRRLLRRAPPARA